MIWMHYDQWDFLTIFFDVLRLTTKPASVNVLIYFHLHETLVFTESFFLEISP